MFKRMRFRFGLLCILLIVTGCSLKSPFFKPQSENHPLPPMQQPIPGPSNNDSGNVDVEPGKFYRMGDRNQKKVALTFDDGPELNWTPKILDILRDKQVRATFFVIGKTVEQYPDIAQRIIAEGHVLGNHTQNHVNLNNVPLETMAAEIENGAAAIAKITQQRPRLFRPPFGAQNPKVIETANNKGQFVILWSIDTEDWRGLNSVMVRNKVLLPIQSGDIILQHNGEGPNLQGTVDALPAIIDELRAKGFELVTIPELLNISGYE